MSIHWRSVVAGGMVAAAVTWGLADERPEGESTAAAKWERGKGWGWIWGEGDEVGSLNAMTDESRLAAVRLVRQGRTYDLGVLYDRRSYKWPGHSPGEIISFRTPEGVKRQQDLPFATNPSGTAWHSCALFVNDNVATQIDGLAHATEGTMTTGTTASPRPSGEATGDRASATPRPSHPLSPAAC